MHCSILLVDTSTVTRTEILQGIRDMESSLSSERVAAARGHNDRASVCYGVGMDDEREHQPVCDGALGCESFRARKSSIYVNSRDPRLLLVVTWLPQLADVARGLIYMHGQGMIHGDLKGVCIGKLLLLRCFNGIHSSGQHPC